MLSADNQNTSTVQEKNAAVVMKTSTSESKKKRRGRTFTYICEAARTVYAKNMRCRVPVPGYPPKTVF